MTMSSSATSVGFAAQCGERRLAVAGHGHVVAAPDEELFENGAEVLLILGR
jgi:hypothetical protein